MEDYSTDERLQQETLCRQQWTDEYVEHPESLNRQNVIVVWIHVSAGRRSSSRRYVGAIPCMLAFVRQNCDLISDALRSLQPVKSAEQRADVVEPRRREYQPGGCIQYRLKSLRYAGMPVKVALPKSSRESTSETIIDWRTGLVTDRQILRRWHKMARTRFCQRETSQT